MKNTILEMMNITKTFSGVLALDSVNLSIEKGEIHALCGENGAGKSTLMKVLSGVYPTGTYEGKIFFNGEECNFKKIKDSEDAGIVIIHQELALIPYLSIAENIFLGNEINNYGVINEEDTNQKAKNLMDIVGLNESPSELIKNLGVGKQQLVEIAKAFSKDVKVLILDEPTAALNEDDSENLLNLMKEFKNQGITSIIITHKLNEVIEVADRVTILRDGKTIETLDKNKNLLNEDIIIKGMVGRDLSQRYPNKTNSIGKTYFEVKNWTVYDPYNVEKKALDDINFHIKKGEIVGIAGLMGAGRTELAMSIFGKSYGTKITGSIIKNGKLLKINSVQDAIKNGLAYVTEDRKENGLVLIENINENISLASLKKISKYSVINENEEIHISEDFKEKLKIKCKNIFQKVENLSGGNQQKVVLAKWMLTDPDILILDEPTRGIDVGAKFEIYSIIQAMAKEGKCICIISSELPELLGMSDRIYTMSAGKITGEFNKSEATQEILMGAMTNEVKEIC